METNRYTYHGITFSYRLYLSSTNEKILPLIVCLAGNPKEHSEEFFNSPEIQSLYPSHVLCPEDRDWSDPEYSQALQRLIFDIRNQYLMDICRTYLVGVGIGAVGAWHMLGSYPRLFAGTIAIGGCGDPYHIRNAVFAPVWAFHAQGDALINEKVPTMIGGKNHLAGSRRMIDALKTAGSELAKYTRDGGESETLPKRVFSDQTVIKWLFEQDRKKVVWVYMITPDVYRFDDWFMSSCYLILGTEKALLIDTTMSHGELLPVIKRITSLPIELAVTHPHHDHMLQAFAFDKVYIHADAATNMEPHFQRIRTRFGDAGCIEKRTNLIPPFFNEVPNLKNVVGINEGYIFDLGGGCLIETRYIGGHTGVDLVFVDKKHRMVFTGDAVGSGYVVGVSYIDGHFRETYEKYRSCLEKFIAYMAPQGEYTYFGGHYIQENSCTDPMQEDYLNHQSTYYVPLTIDVIKDMKKLCDGLLNGAYDHEISTEDGSFFVKYGDAALAARRLISK